MNPGEILDGRYDIVQRLGAGGMGEVYKATHILLGATRVIKVVHPNISTNTDARERFLREARAATKVQHPNVATVHDFAALPDGSHYMVWEFIDGENLAQRLRTRGPLPPKNALRIGIQALRGLEAIHRAGIIHRDISPENLMISHADDSVKIIDLGVAKIEEDAGAVSQTKTGIFVGKLRYASPEQLGFLPDGERVDGRADLYAMAMVIVELLTGRPPYEATSPHEYFIIHAREATLTTVKLPEELPGSAALKESMEKALSRDRNARYASAGEFAVALEEIEKTLPDPRGMPTMALPLDGDETMRITPKRIDTNADTLHRETVRTHAPAEPTIRTPLPVAEMPPPLPLFTPEPPPPPPPTPTPDVLTAGVPRAKPQSGINAIWIVMLVVFATMITAAVLLYPRVKKAIVQFREPTTSTTATTATTAPTTTTTGEVAQTTMTVMTDTGELHVTVPALTETASTTAVTTTRPVFETTTRSTDEPTLIAPIPRDPVEEPQEREPALVRYVEGGNPARNRLALRVLRRQLRGAQAVGVVGTGDARMTFPRALRSALPDGIEFDIDAPITIRYEGGGRGTNHGLGTVSRGDEVFFRYESSFASPQGFASVIAQAFE